MRRKAQVPLLLLLLATLAGCSKPYVVTTPLVGTVPPETVISIGELGDALPEDLPLEDRPSAEDVAKFRDFLRSEIEKRGDLGLLAITEGTGDFEVRGRMIDYTRGSGLMRFLIGFGAGAAKVTVELQLIDNQTHEIVFGGNFYAEVYDGLVAGTDMFRMVARNFTKELEEQIEAELDE